MTADGGGGTARPNGRIPMPVSTRKTTGRSQKIAPDAGEIEIPGRRFIRERCRFTETGRGFPPVRGAGAFRERNRPGCNRGRGHRRARGGCGLLQPGRALLGRRFFCRRFRCWLGPGRVFLLRRSGFFGLYLSPRFWFFLFFFHDWRIASWRRVAARLLFYRFFLRRASTLMGRPKMFMKPEASFWS